MASRLVAARLGFKNKMRMGGLDVIILEKGNGCQSVFFFKKRNTKGSSGRVGLGIESQTP